MNTTLNTARLSPATDRLVERLTQPHTESADGHPVNWPPLIDWISDAVTDQVKRGGASSGEGSAGINEGALAILNRIKRGTVSLRGWLYLAPIAEGVKADLASAWEAAHMYRQRGELNDEAWERITDEIARWVSDIEAEWDDRPRRQELVVPCPSCGERWILEHATNENTPPKRRTAVTIEYAAGRAPIAECRVDGCGGHWVGWAQIAWLGRSLNAEQNVDVLRACGIDLDLPQLSG